MKDFRKIMIMAVLMGVGICIFFIYISDSEDTTSNQTIIETTLSNDSKNEISKVIDNSWLLGSWGPVTVEGVPPLIEYLQIQYHFLDSENIQEVTLTKLTSSGVQNRLRRNPYQGSNDISVERENYKYIVDNENNQIIINTGDNYGGNIIYFNKDEQTLNIGTPSKPHYMRKVISDNSNNSNSSKLSAEESDRADEDIHIPHIEPEDYDYQEDEGVEIAAPTYDNQIYEKVDIMPQFQGGKQELRIFLERNLKYPAIAAENGIQGTVNVRFIVNRDGTISDITITKSLDSYLDREVIRVIKSMPKWIAGEQNGQNVDVYITLPINFRLNCTTVQRNFPIDLVDLNRNFLS